MIEEFRGKYYFLSNFYRRRIIYDNHLFPTNEHAYHYKKSIDKAYQTQLMVQEEIDRWNEKQRCINAITRESSFYLRLGDELTPMKSKKFGDRKRLIQKGLLRPDWFHISLQIMYDINMAKYVQHKDLRERLLATGGKVLIEGNTWGDKFWGMVLSEPGNPWSEWIGENHLGKILMVVRSKIKQFMKEGKI